MNCHIETEGLLKVTGSQVHCESLVISRKVYKTESLLLPTTDMTYQTAPLSSTFKVIYLYCKFLPCVEMTCRKQFQKVMNSLTNSFSFVGIGSRNWSITFNWKLVEVQLQEFCISLYSAVYIFKMVHSYVLIHSVSLRFVNLHQSSDWLIDWHRVYFHEHVICVTLQPD